MNARDLLKALMAKTGDNPTSLAKKTNVPQPTIYRFLSGTAKEPRLSTFEPIARYFGVPAEAFLSEKVRATVAAQLEAAYRNGGGISTAGATIPSVGKTLRLLRMVRGLSPEDLAEKAGVTGEALAAIEADQGGTDADMAAIAKTFRLTPGDLATEIVQSLDDARALIERAERRAYVPALEVMPDRTNRVAEPQPEYVGRYHATRRLPVVGIAQLGENGYYEQLEYPVGHGDGYLFHASRDPEAYVLQVRGDSMKPAIRNGWYVVVEPNGTPEPGEYVVVQLVDGRKMVKELLFRHARTGDVEVMSVNGETRISLVASQIQSIQPVAAVMPPSKVINE